MTKASLAELFGILLAEELENTGIEAEVRNTVEGFELRCTYRYSGVLTLDERRLNDPDFAQKTKWEAIGLVRAMRRAMIKAGEGKFDER